MTRFASASAGPRAAAGSSSTRAPTAPASGARAKSAAIASEPGAPTPSAARPPPETGRSRSAQRPGEAQLVAVRIGDVEVALAPFGVARLGLGVIARGDQPVMEGVDIGVIEDHAAPPGPAPLG